MEELDHDINPKLIKNELARYILLVKGPESKFFDYNNKRVFPNVYINVIYYWKCLYFIVNESTFFLAYIIMPFLGFFLDPIIFTFQLFNIIVIIYELMIL